jgi:hypothetical protein
MRKVLNSWNANTFLSSNYSDVICRNRSPWHYLRQTKTIIEDISSVVLSTELALESTLKLDIYVQFFVSNVHGQFYLFFFFFLV